MRCNSPRLQSHSRTFIFGMALSFALGMQLAPSGAKAELLSAAAATRLAAEHSPPLKRALQAIAQARAAVRVQQGRYVPTFTGAATYQRTNMPTLGMAGITRGLSDDVTLSAGIAHLFPFGSTISANLEMGFVRREFAQPNIPVPIPLGPGYDLTLTLQFTQPLMRGFGLDPGEAPLRAAQAALRQAEQAEVRAASEVALSVQQAWWEAWFAERSLHTENQALEVTRARWTDLKARVQSGLLSPLAANPVQVAVASAEEAVATSQIRAGRARLELGRRMGLTAAEVSGLKISVDEAEDLPGPPELPQVLADLLEHHPELTEASAAIEQAHQAVSVAADAARIRLDARAWVSATGLGDRSIPDALSMWGELRAVSAFVGLEVELPTDRTALDQEVARTLAAVKAAEEVHREVELRLQAQAADALLAWAAANQAAQGASRTRALAEEAAAGQRARLDAGAAGPVDWLLAQQEVRAAALRQDRARADAALAALTVAHLRQTLLAKIEISE